ncbi:single-stranded DNA-binding protein [Fluviicola chungangensis]|uniref:Single-stranded DNA-binding protein n=1 Tax=Fluviicola chungangensis TaxID=2597671 RepID=A0A556MPT4_9FLAO|nr:single-stranded DNA-binding protein [Fluviicola chungangensis]TSJ41964.1 single-stranded DNA-binding protein [Fluviicola chungangensis]
MSGSVNKVILIGNLGKDPEVRRLENGTVVASFPIATSETYVDRTTGERKDNTDWHNIVAWRGLAEVVEKYVRKGIKVYIEGKLKTRSWTDQSGTTRYTTEVVADELTILTPRGDQEKPMGTATPPYPAEEPQNPSPMNLDISPNDDLPF